VARAVGFLVQQDDVARELAMAASVVDDNKILPGVLGFQAALPILTASESTTSSTPVVTAQRTIWRGSLINMNRIAKVEAEVDWGSAGGGSIALYNVSTSSAIASLVSVSAATSRSTQRYDVTSYMKGITSDAVIALQIAGDGTNALTVYRASLLVYLS
jgi:hypothetical protein